MGRGRSKGENMDASRNLMGQNPCEWGKTMRAVSHLEWTPIPTEWGWGRGAARPLEWQKTPGGAATE